ncbi:MAG: AraC family transcriptional regulator [Spirochaetes bacterium]|nr:AraC family transcriptional regulator [Spirochaetota bacterium]
MQELTFPADFPFIIFSYDIPGTLKDLHLHDCMEIGLVESGTGEFHVDRKVFGFTKGDMVLINRHESHRAKSTGTAKARAVFIYVSDTFLADLISLTGNIGYYRLVTLGGSQFTNLFRDDVIGARIIEVFRENERQASQWKPRIRAVMADVMVLLVRRFEKQFDVGATPDAFAESLLSVYDYINRHFEKKMAVRDLADITRMSESHFRKRFREYTGKSPLDYIAERRLKNAYILITEKNMSANEAAHLSGFSNYATFLANYKREYGTLPKRGNRTAAEKE